MFLMDWKSLFKSNCLTSGSKATKQKCFHFMSTVVLESSLEVGNMLVRLRFLKSEAMS